MAEREEMGEQPAPGEAGQTSGPEASRLAPWLVAGTAAFFLYNAWTYRHYLIDDAYISLRYARHLADGHGLVFNVGERVEGYTNFLWTLLGAAALELGLDGMLTWKLISALSAAVMLLLAGRLIARPADASTVFAHRAVPAALWLLGLEAFGYWSTSGMESTAFAALFTWAAWLALEEAERGHRRGSVLGGSVLGGSVLGGSVLVGAALVLLRPEGPLVCALTRIGPWLFLELPHPERRWRALRRHAVDGALVAAVLALHVLWRHSFYGDLLPNTYYAKVTGGAEQWTNGFINLGQWVRSQPVFAAALVLPLLVLPAWLRAWRHGDANGDRNGDRHVVTTRKAPPHGRLLAVWSMAAGWLVYVVSVGGDFMPFYRFFLPVLALLAALTAGLVALLPRRRLTVGVALLVLQAMAGLQDEQNYRAFVAHRTTVVGEDVGRFFRQAIPEDEWMAVNTAGAVPYESRRPTIDMLGLTDAAIARHPVYVISPLWAGHRRGWGAYVRSRRPAVILWYNSAGLAEPHYLGDHQLADDPIFRFFYQQKRHRLPAREGDRILARFGGAPFGEPPRGARRGATMEGTSEGKANRLPAPELGLSFEVRRRPFTHTLARDAPIVVTYFQRRDDAEHLWPLVPGASDAEATISVEALLSAVRAHWRRQWRAGDVEARRRVEALCERARRAVVAGRLSEAKRLLSQAAAQNGAARSPLVYQYVANVATLERDLFLAVQAQREALRLDPDNELYIRNLRSLLTVPYDDFTATAEEFTDEEAKTRDQK